MKPILNLNKHPKNCENLSLVYSKNVRLSNDGVSLQSEEALIDKEIINREITDEYPGGFKYIAFIPCNKELIIFVADNTLIEEDANYPIDIWRYNEELNQIKLVYEQYDYYQGKIKGDFTYNVHNDLIIAIAESDAIEDVPLKTINLGKFEEDKEQLSNQLLPINPEVYVPTLFNYEYIVGNLPKGWYHIFVRYKIDNVDYTKWLDVGGDILINDIERQSIFRFYGYNATSGKTQPFTLGSSDYFSTNEDITNETVKLEFAHLDERYKIYQIGIICHNTTNILCYSSSDINIVNSQYILNLDTMHECSIEEILTDVFNIYDAINLINYKNRLYVSNYKEKLLDEYDTSNIKLNIYNDNKEYFDVSYYTYKTNISDLEDAYKTLEEEVALNDNVFVNDTAEAKIKGNLVINNIKYNTILDNTVLDLEDFSNVYSISTLDENYKLKPQCRTEGYYMIIEESLKILTSNNNILNIQMYIKYGLRSALKEEIVQFTYVIGDKTFITTGKIGNVKGYDGVAFRLTGGNINSTTLIPTNEISEDAVSTINTYNSYKNRRKNTSLIPGEVYNFYIHFVDKCGQSTRGFKINPIKQLSYGVPILINHPSCKYVLMKENTNVFDELGNIDLSYNDNCWGVFNTLNYYKWEDRLVANGACAVGNTITEIEEILRNLYGNLNKNKDLKWEDLAVGNIEGREFDTEEDYNQWFNGEKEIENTIISFYIPYTNKNNISLFKIPYAPIAVKNINGVDTYVYPNIKFNISNVTIPKNYIGYFISYEKLEETCKCTGILTKYDFNSEQYTNNNLTLYNNAKNTKMYFYTSDFDILSKVDLQYNAIRVESKNIINSLKNPDVIENAVLSNVDNLNIHEIKQTDDFDTKYYGLDNYNILVGGDTIKNRFGLGTCLEIPIEESLFPDGEINIYKASLMLFNNNNYVSDDKILIKCTNVIYPEYEAQTFIEYLNGRNTYNNFLVYDNNKFIYDDAENRVYGEKGKVYLGYGTDDENNNNDNRAKFISYIQLPVYKQFFYETKSFKNKPLAVSFSLTENKEDFDIALGVIVKPQNSIDLFENKFVHPDDYCPKYYTNNRTDIKYITQFDKFVRRSDIIQDESASNAWRQFGVENYKVISENKGKITNLVGIGHYLLVHTEHSLFAFDNSSTLKALDQEIQLATPDIFDIDYKELITSDLGFAGLQDGDAYCIDSFGYIFYDNDSNRIFRFDEGSLNYIDTDIVQWLNKYKPNQIRFAVDKKSSRVLCIINIDDITANHDVILSYSYGINKFIAFHDYIIKQAVNTKNELYLVDDLGKINVFNHNSLVQDNYSENQCELQIIINDTYDRIKYLEYIIYRMFAVDFTNKDIEADSHIYPVEEMLKPYSGLLIRVYNDEVDTGWLDCQIDFEEDKNRFANYTLPYWDKGNWNFSYLRDAVDKMRLYGNYFVVCFKFGGATNRFEFESLGYNITKDRRI